MIFGIDLGSTAREVDWNLIKENGVSFAIIKATQGSYRANQIGRASCRERV